MKIQSSLIFIFLLCCFKSILAEEERCGVEFGLSCKEGYCCSRDGYCGNTEDHCGAGCQLEYGKCSPIDVDINNGSGSPCGPLFDNKVCENGECCSKDGYCGFDIPFCGEGCQPEFGNCHIAPKGLVGPAFILPKKENGAKAITDIPPKTVPPRPPKDASDVKIITLRPPITPDVKTVPITPNTITSKTLPPTPVDDINPKTLPPDVHIIPKTLPFPPDVPKTLPLTTNVYLTTKTIPSSIPEPIKTIQPRPPSDLDFKIIPPGSDVPPAVKVAPHGLKSSAIVNDPIPVLPEIIPTPKTISKTTIIITTTILKPEISPEI